MLDMTQEPCLDPATGRGLSSLTPSARGPKYYYLKDIEKKDYIHNQNEEIIPVTETDLANMEQLLLKIAPGEFMNINNLSGTFRKKALRDAFLIKFRQVWPRVR